MGSKNKNKDDRKETGRKSDPSPKGGGGGRKEARERVQKYVRTMDATKLALKKSGLLKKNQGGFVPVLGGQLGNAVDKKDAKKLNKYLKKNDYSLEAGDGRAVIGFKNINIQPERNFALMNKGQGYAAPRDEMVAIYGPVKSKKGDRNKGGGGRGEGGGYGGGGSSGSGRTTATDRSMANLRQNAEDRIYGRVPEGWKPPMFPEGESIEGRAPEAIADYTDRLDRYNQNMIGWMNDRAVASQYEMGSFLDRFAAGLPPAPDVMSPSDILKISQRGARTSFG